MQAPTLFIIAADLTKMQVNANIDEADVGRIRPGQHVTFRVDAYPTDTFDGTVSQIRLQPVVRPERHDLRHGHRRAERAAEAQAGHDGERQGRDREAHATCCACRPPHCASGRRPNLRGAESAGAA